MTEKYSKDKLIEIVIDSNKKMVVAITMIKDNLKAINDQNVLHCQTLERNTQMTSDLVVAVNVVAKNFRWFVLLLFLLVGTLIIIAGAEKVFTYIPIKL